MLADVPFPLPFPFASLELDPFSSRIPGEGNSGNVPSRGVRPPGTSLFALCDGDPPGFVGELDEASSVGNRFAVELAGRPSLIACFC